MELDELDRRLIEELRIHPRETNKALGQALGVSEVVIATRIRRLTDSKVLRLTAQAEMTWLGFDYAGFADVYVRGRTVRSVADDLARIDEVIAVSIMLGSPELSLNLEAIDRLDMARNVMPRIAAVEGIDRITLYPVLEMMKFYPIYGRIA